MTRIVEEVHWDWYGVRNMCINHSLYTCGSNEDYSALLDEVRETMYATPESIYYVAFDILEHSDTDMRVEDIMYHLNKEAVIRFYNIGRSA
ncbi:hypothetical protein [Anaerovibrio sp. RM50]|uniref:hypothetical protein n=1 Tax=Anaerovibrio sp. RM50 TaxID=1200557 RepID=UPI000483B838|nr:hypothetical protein [Anaerovibrio sp. RM50]